VQWACLYQGDRVWADPERVLMGVMLMRGSDAEIWRSVQLVQCTWLVSRSDVVAQITWECGQSGYTRLQILNCEFLEEE
jgi:hypothetical protein